MAGFETKVKDPEAVLPFYWVWYDWLEEETLTEHSIKAPSGITVDSSQILATEIEIEGTTYPANTVVEVWLSGGKAGKKYDIVCHVKASDTREDDRTMTIDCRHR